MTAGNLLAMAMRCATPMAAPRTIGLMLQIEGQGFDKIQASNVMLAGLRAYCPEKTPPR